MSYPVIGSNRRVAVATVAAMLGLMGLIGAQGRASADDSPKPDGWCRVVKAQIEHNQEEVQKGHDAAGAERLLKERLRLEKDYQDHHCNGQ
jgi:hypothetical protein